MTTDVHPAILPAGLAAIRTLIWAMTWVAAGADAVPLVHPTFRPKS